MTQVFYQGSTALIRVACIDEEGNPVVPNTLAWTLKKNGAVVNDRDAVPITTPDLENDILLSGADLVGGNQCLIVAGTYNSSAGFDLPVRKWIDFFVAASC